MSTEFFWTIEDIQNNIPGISLSFIKKHARALGQCGVKGQGRLFLRENVLAFFRERAEEAKRRHEFTSIKTIAYNPKEHLEMIKARNGMGRKTA